MSSTVENTQTNTQSTQSNMDTIPKTKFNVSLEIGKCGKNKNKLWIPLFLPGGCGDSSLVKSGKHISKPRKMDYNWFLKTAKVINKNRFLDWDWSSFLTNILEPNKEHIKQVNNFDDKTLENSLNDLIKQNNSQPDE